MQFPGRQEGDISLPAVLSYMADGLKIALSKECRLYIIIPVAVNFLVLTIAGILLFNYLQDFIGSIAGKLPGFLQAIISFFLISSLLLASCYIFSTLAVIIASPFYGLLAEKVEAMLSGKKTDDDSTLGAAIADALKDTPRVLKRELQKQLFFLPRALLCFIIMVIPGLNLLFPILWFLLTAWMGCMQFCDYAFDNNKIGFRDMRRDLNQNRLATCVFGAIVALLLTVPVLNLLIPPAAVCAGTKYYLKMREHVQLMPR